MAGHPNVLENQPSLRYPHEEPPAPSLTQLDVTHIPYRNAASYIKSQLESKSISIPTVGIICGSGLSSLSKGLDTDTEQITIP